MAVTAAQLNVKVSAQGASETQAALGGVSNATGGALGAAAKLFAIGGAAIVGFGVASVKMAANWQEAMTQLVVGAGEFKPNIDLVSAGLLNMAVATGTSATDLANAMFIVESQGYRGALGLRVMTIAAEGAKVGGADLTATTNTLTLALHDYGLGAGSAVPVMNSLIETVKDGNMHMDDLTGSMTKVLPVSDAFKVKMSDVEGALAVMAAAGDKGAAAGTHLQMMLKALADPAKAATTEMAAMGINSTQLAMEMRTSLPGAMAEITDAVGKKFPAGSVQYNNAIAAILGGSKSGIAGLELLSGGVKALNTTTQNIAATMTNAGTSVQGFGDVQQDFNFKMSQAKEVVETLMISIGTKLLPVVTQLTGFFVSNVAPALTNLVQLVSTNKDAFTIFAAVIGTVLVGALGAAAIAAWAFVGPILIAAAPILGIAAAVAAVVVILKLAYDHFGFVRIAVQSLMSAVTGQLLPALQQLWDVLQPVLLPALKVIGAIIGGVVVVAFLLFVNTLTHVVVPGVTALITVISVVVTALKGVATVVGTVASTVGTIVHGMVGAVTGDTDGMRIAAEQKTAEMRDKVVATFIDQQKRTVASEMDRRAQIIAQIQATTNPAVKASLEKQLGVVNAQIQEHNQTIASAEDQRAKITARMAQLKQDAINHANLMKMGVVGHVIEMGEDAGKDIGSMATVIGGKIIDLKNAVVTDAQNLATGFVVKLVGLVSSAGTEAGDIGTAIMDEINRLPAQLLAAGGNMIHALVQGILGQLGSVASAAGSIVQTVANFFPHSPAKEGPLMDLPNWGPRIVGTIAGGIAAGTGAMRQASGALTGALRVSGSGAGGIAVSNAASYSGGGGGSGQPIVLQLDSRTVGQILMPSAVQQIRNRVGVRT